jgi:peptide/nickel transport system substrate-binding protein/oligopeptide transport system substrate-binding protein
LLRLRRGARLAAASAVVLTFATLAAVTSCTSQPSGSNQANGDAGGTVVGGDVKVSNDAFRIGVVSRSVLDPAAALPTNQAEMMTADLLFDSLTSIDSSTGAAAPGLAWTWSVSDDQTTWRFSLHDGIKFSDGTPITPADVKASLERVAKQSNDECARSNGADPGATSSSSTAAPADPNASDPNASDPNAPPTTVGGKPTGRCPSLAGLRLDVIDGYLEFIAGNAPDIRGLKVIDDHVLEIDTREPFAPLPELLASPNFGVLPKGTGSSDDFEKHIVTSGPYMVVDRSDSVVKLQKSPYSPSPAAVEKIDLVHFFDLPGSYQAFEDGKVDWTLVPADKVDDAKGKYGADAIKPFSAEQFFGINLSNAKFTDDRFRAAMVKAVNQDQMISKVLPERPELKGAVPPGVPGGTEDACGDACKYDPDGAKALLAQVFPDGKVPNVDIEVYDDQTQQALANELKDEWDAVGIPATVTVKSIDDFPSFVVSGQQEVFGIGWVGLYPDPDAYLAPLFLSTSLDNVTGYSDPNLDGAIKAARGVSDRESRIALYDDMQKQVMSKLPIIPVVASNTNAIVAKRVKGYVGRIDGTFDVDKLQLTP